MGMSINQTTSIKKETIWKKQNAKTHSGRNKLSSPIPIKEFEFIIERYPAMKMDSLFIPPNIWGRNNENYMQMLPEIWRGKNTSQIIFWDHHYPDTKTRQRYYKRNKGKYLSWICV